MANLAYLKTEKLECPCCGQDLPLPHGILQFQWGYCPGRQLDPQRGYKWGDAILWRSDEAGRIPSWVYFRGTDAFGANVGDPSIANLRVRAFALGWNEIVCDACGASSIDIQIERGILTKVVAATPGCEIACIAPDGRIIPCPEWDDRPMSTHELHRACQFVIPDAMP